MDTIATTNPTRSTWICGFCTTSAHEDCRGAVLNPGGKIKFMQCACTEHDHSPRCLECGNRRADELTGWSCTNPTDCADAIAARSAANPLREELQIVRYLGGEARRRALDERLQRQIALAAERAAVTFLPDGRPVSLTEDCAVEPRRAPRVRAPKVEKPKTGTCICGCAGTTRGGRFLPGHDAKLKSALKKAIEGGDSSAYDRMVELGWERFAVIAVKAREKALAKAS